MRRFTRLNAPRVAFSRPSFQEYLEQKRWVDERSFNVEVWERARSRLVSQDDVRVLDVGTGTGAMARRLIAAWDAAARKPASLRVTGVDLEERSLAEARRQTASLLESLGYAVGSCDLGAEGTRAGMTVVYRFRNSDALSLRGLGTRFHLVTGHAVLDLLPLDAAFREIAAVLVSGGAFYTTLNYDARTQFSPPSSMAAFERDLLAWYNRTMDDRRVAGMPTGGSRCGTEMIAAAERAGLTVAAAGSSDWNVQPGRKGYCTGAAGFLRSLLWMVYDEGQRDRRCNRRLLDEWFSQRMAQIDDGLFGLRVAQTDMLAVCP
jgi:SAM-dependent methyltransferase